MILSSNSILFYLQLIRLIKISAAINFTWRSCHPAGVRVGQ